MPDSNNQDYVWKFSDIRKLDQRLSNLESDVKSSLSDIRELRTEMQIKNRLVVDNTEKYDWKAVSALIVAVIGALGALYLTIRQGQ